MPHDRLRNALRDQWVARDPEVQRAARELRAANGAASNLAWKGDVATYVEERAALRAAVERAEHRLDDACELSAAHYDAALSDSAA
jgi:hypothetical protein